MSLKVALVNVCSSTDSPPLGLLSLATYAEKYGYKVDIINYGLGEKIASVFDYDIVGFGFMTVHANLAYNLLAEIKSKKPEIYTIAGGPHPTVCPKETATYFDVVIQGEGEKTFTEILEKFNSGIKLKGIVPGERVNMEELPLINFDKVNIDAYLIERGKSLNVKRGLSYILTRGCPFSCRFCQPTLDMIFGKGFRSKSPKKIRGEIKTLIDKYDIQGFAFQDDGLTYNLGWLKELCCILKDHGLKWAANSRVDTISKEKLKIMKESGCVKIEFGVESGNDYIRNDVLGKNVSKQQIYDAFKMARDVGIQDIKGYFMVGAPGETNETILDTEKMIESLNPTTSQISIFVPLPGTYIYEDIKEKVKGIDWYKFDYFKHALFDPSPNLSAKEVEAIYYRLLRKRKLRLSKILKSLTEIRSLTELINVIKKGAYMYQFFNR